MISTGPDVQRLLLWRATTEVEEIDRYVLRFASVLSYLDTLRSIEVQSVWGAIIVQDTFSSDRGTLPPVSTEGYQSPECQSLVEVAEFSRIKRELYRW